MLEFELPESVRPALAAARESGEDVSAALDIARAVGRVLPPPGGGRTVARWAVLAALGEANLTVARATEPQADALAILAEAGEIPDPETDLTRSTWGVFAAEAPGVRLEATVAAAGATLTGRKPWCSLAERLDAALVTAHVGDRRGLFRVHLHSPGVDVQPAQGWVARGLRTIVSVAVDFDAVPATAVGAPGWYLERPGFAWGGMGVAACWYGGARGLAATLRATAARRADPVTDLHLGRVDTALHAAGATLSAAARAVDRGVTGAAGRLLAERVRAVVAEAAEVTLREVAHALGPAPSAFDPVHAARMADLDLYLRQHHGERDLSALGALVRTQPGG